MRRARQHPSIPDPNSWASLRHRAATLVGHNAIDVHDDCDLHGDWITARFVGIMVFGSDVAVGSLRVTPAGERVRQVLDTTAGDGVRLVWEQVCSRSRDALSVELVRLDPDTARGQGHGRRAFRNFLLWCELAGVRRVELDAGKDVGGYYWARCGFLPAQADWAAVVAAMKAQAERLGHRSLQTLIQRASTLGPAGLALLAGSQHGKELLLHGRWRGVLDLANPAQLQRAQSYAHPSAS